MTSRPVVPEFRAHAAAVVDGPTAPPGATETMEGWWVPDELRRNIIHNLRSRFGEVPDTQAVRTRIREVTLVALRAAEQAGVARSPRS